MAKGKVFVNVDFKLASGMIRRKARAGLVLAGQQLENELIDVLSIPPRRSGEVYSRGKGRKHTASAPGEAPAPDSGQLRQSLVNYIEEGVSGELTAIAGTPLEYGAILHFGAPSKNLAPRPWLDAPIREPAALARIKRAFALGAKAVR